MGYCTFHFYSDITCFVIFIIFSDVSIWIYQAQLAYPSDQPFPHLRLLVNRLSKLLFYKIRPVFVFDGPQVPPLKRQVLEARRQKRQNDDDILKNSKKMGKLKVLKKSQKIRVKLIYLELHEFFRQRKNNKIFPSKT